MTIWQKSFLCPVEKWKKRMILFLLFSLHSANIPGPLSSYINLHTLFECVQWLSLQGLFGSKIPKIYYPPFEEISSQSFPEKTISYFETVTLVLDIPTKGNSMEIKTKNCKCWKSKNKTKNTGNTLQIMCKKRKRANVSVQEPLSERNHHPCTYLSSHIIWVCRALAFSIS